MGMLKKLTWNLSRKKQQAKLRYTNTKTLQFIKELKINITTMFRLNLKLTICNLSRFLQERKLVFSQGSFWEFLVSTDDVCGTKVKLHLQIWFERNDPIVLGFPKSCARTKTLCIAPPRLAQVFGHVSELVPSAHIALEQCHRQPVQN